MWALVIVAASASLTRVTLAGRAARRCLTTRATLMTPATGDPLDVLVVGAGPTGLTLTAVRAFGATVRIVDRQLDRVHESRPVSVQPHPGGPRGLGWPKSWSRGNDAIWVQLHAGGRAVRIRLFGLGLDDTAYPFLLFVSQAD